MKKYKAFLAVFMLQLALLLYLNNIYLPRANTYTLSLYDQYGHGHWNTGIIIPDGATDVSLSQDFSYVAYKQNGRVEVIDLNTREKVSLLREDSTIGYYTWVRDINSIIYTYSYLMPSGDEAFVKAGVVVNVYNMDTGVDRSFPAITSSELTGDVLSIEASPYTNLMYIKLMSIYEEAEIYKFNIIEELTYIGEAGINDNMAGMNYSAALLIEKNNRQLQLIESTQDSASDIDFNEDTILLGIDHRDRIYVIKPDEKGNVNGVYTADAQKAVGGIWNRLDFIKEVQYNNILFTHSGNIYIVSDEKRVILNTANGMKQKLEGRFIQMNDTAVAEIRDKRLVISSNGCL